MIKTRRTDRAKKRANDLTNSNYVFSNQFLLGDNDHYS